MAKRGRAISIDRLLSELASLDKQRVALQGRIRGALASAIGTFSGESPFPWKKRKPGRPAGSTNRTKSIIIHGRRKMSKAARAKISAAQKARWAKQKAGKK